MNALTLRELYSSWNAREAACPGLHGTARVECCVTGDMVLVNDAVWLKCERHAMLGSVAQRWAEACHTQGVAFSCPACRTPDVAMKTLLRATKPHAGNDAAIAQVTGHGGFGSVLHTRVHPHALYHTVRSLVTLFIMLSDKAEGTTARAVLSVMRRLQKHMPRASRAWYASVLTQATTVQSTLATPDRAACVLQLACTALAKTAMLCVISKAVHVWRPVHKLFLQLVVRHRALAATRDAFTRCIHNKLFNDDAVWTPQLSVRALRWYACLVRARATTCSTNECLAVWKRATTATHTKPPSGNTVAPNDAVLAATHDFMLALMCAPPPTFTGAPCKTLRNAARFALDVCCKPSAAVHVFYNRLQAVRVH